MAHIAIIDKKTNQVVNIVVKPEGSNAWFVGEGFIAIESNVAKKGDIYNSEKNEFLPDPVIEESRLKRQSELSESEKIKESLEIKRNKIQAAIDSLKSKKELTIEEEGNLAALENSLENVMMKLT